MIKKIKKSIAVLAAAAMMAGALTGCAAEKLDSAETVAVLGEEKIPMGVASLFARYQQAQMYTMYNMYMGSGAIFDQIYGTDSLQTYGELMKEDIMGSLEEMYVLKAHADEFEVSLTEEETAEIAEAAKSFAEANGAEVLEAIGTTEEHAAELLTLYTYQTKMQDAMAADVDTEVSDDEAAQSKVTYVQISLAGTETDEDGNVIELTEEEKAEKADLAQSVLDKIMAEEDVAAADMDALAKEVDETLSATEYTYDDEDTTLDTAILEAVDGLADGTLVEGVVTASDASTLYIVRFDAELDREATDAEKENIIATRQQEDYTAELTEWVEAAEFEVVEEAWDKISINDSNVFTFAESETEEAAE